MKRIAIAGGGPSALFTAFLLELKSSEDIDITLFEAQGRLGGKVQTTRFDAAPILYEAGVAELYRYGDDPLWLLITRLLGLPVVPMAGDVVVFEGKLLEKDADIAKHFGERTARALREFDRAARNTRSFDQFYNGGWPADNRHPWAKKTLRELLSGVTDPVARRYLEVLIHSDVATEPHVTSGLYGIDNYLINDPAYCRLYSIVGGIDRLISTVAGRLRRTRIELGARVAGVDKTEGGAYRLAVERGGESVAEDFDAVAVALPTYSLRQVAFGGAALRRAVDRHVARYDDPAHYLRITGLFRTPFWRQAVQGSYFIHDAFGGTCVYDEGTRHDAGEHGVLSWLLGGTDALAMSALDDETLVRRVIDSLPAVIAPPGTAREQLLEGRVHRFIGMVNGRPAGSPIEGSRRRHRPDPAGHAGLFFVGDYLFDATTNGALDSADITSSLLLEHMRIPARIMALDDFDAYCGGEQCYEAAFERAFDARHVTELVRAVWGASPPYRLLDAGSASGATLQAFAALGVDAWGVENGWYIHAKTPEALRERNLFADVWEMPFPDGHFDFVYETCLSYVPEARLDAALAELHRVTKRGLVLGSIGFGSMSPDAPPELFEKYGPLHGVQCALSPDEWAERLRRIGFREASLDSGAMAALWSLDAAAPRGRPVRPDPESLTCAFWEKAQP
jgi:monoamine oxidase/SAM-dependent methyltransferase